VVLSLASVELLTDSQTFLATARGGAGLPFPGDGATVDRFNVLRTTSACNPSVGRLLEAHCDAQAIFHEANVEIPQNMAMAVWATSSLSRVAGTKTRNGILLNGTQHFCGGAGVVDGALMTVSCDDGERLVFIHLNQIGIEVDLSKWKTSAFSEASVGTVRITNVEIREADMVGDPYFYSSRPGFWWGAVGVAACWAGITDRLIDLQRQRLTRCDEIANVQLGLQSALCWSINASLDFAGRLIDQPSSESARRLALSVRHQVASAGAKILESIEHEAGPAPFAFDPDWVQAVTELRMALGQYHGDRDLGELGNLMLCS
jgi:hypothetical protein